MRDINIYLSFDSWMDETPDAVIRGTVISRGEGFMEIHDVNGLTQVLNLNKLYAVVY